VCKNLTVVSLQTNKSKVILMSEHTQSWCFLISLPLHSASDTLENGLVVYAEHSGRSLLPLPHLTREREGDGGGCAICARSMAILYTRRCFVELNMCLQIEASVQMADVCARTRCFRGRVKSRI
jgi:hypothetical protein